MYGSTAKGDVVKRSDCILVYGSTMKGDVVKRSVRSQVSLQVQYVCTWISLHVRSSLYVCHIMYSTVCTQVSLYVHYMYSLSTCHMCTKHRVSVVCA